MYRTMTLAFAASAIALFVSCSKPPQESTDSATSALEAAKTAGAEEYAPKAWQLAQDAMSSATAEVEAQNQKFALFRSYTAAQQLLDKARELSNAASTEAVVAQEKAKRVAEATIQEAEVAIAAARTVFETAPKGKGTQADLAAMKAELESMTTSLSSARDAFNEGRFLMAQTRAASVKEGANGIATDIRQAKTKQKRAA